ncbi:MAG: threonine synthase [Pseudomonadota bacterium]
MKFYNIKNENECVTFSEAITKGIGAGGGLYFPTTLPHFDDINTLLSKDFVTRSAHIVNTMINDEIPLDITKKCIKAAFNFPIHVRRIKDNIFALELFHGPTLAFKDFGARFMAQMLTEINKKAKNTKPIRIITATSGDTGAAVAHAFYGMPNLEVAILYPYQRISELQEKMFCTMGGNIHTFAIKGDFDACQTLVKQCLQDDDLTDQFRLNSANSINISRVIAQSLYYFEAIAQMGIPCQVISVPSGNFGNLTAGLFARQMGLPTQSFIAATNANDTVPRYLSTDEWMPNDTIATISNAMDVSQPNNWPRVEEFFAHKEENIHDVVRGVSINEDTTKQAMHELKDLGYIADPHSAIAYKALSDNLKSSENGIFLCTAHPAKFKQSILDILGVDIPLPKEISAVAEKPVLSTVIDNDFNAIKKCLLTCFIR